MKRRKLIIGSAILLCIALLFAYVLVSQEPAPSFSFVSGQRGRLGNLHSENSYVMWVTNIASVSIGLEEPVVKFDLGGEVGCYLGESWGGDKPYVTLPSKGVGYLPFDIPTDATRYRVEFSYSCSGGPVRMGISRLLHKPFYSRLSPKLQNWLYRNGLFDGKLHREIEGPWMPNAAR